MFCELCEEWKHIKCDNVKEDTYVAMNKEEVNDARIHWFCLDCNEKATKGIKLVLCLKKKIEQLEATMNEFTALKDSLQEKVSDIADMQDSLTEQQQQLTDKVTNAEFRAVSREVTNLNGVVNTLKESSDRNIKETVHVEVKEIIKKKIEEREAEEGDDYDALERFSSSQEQSDDLKKLQDEIQEIRGMVDNVKENSNPKTDQTNVIRELQATMKEIQDQNEIIMIDTLDTSPENGEKWTDIVSKNLRKEVVKAVAQKAEIGKREKNIILYRVKEKDNKDEAKENDRETIQKLLEHCKVEKSIDTVAEHRRIGAKTTDKDRPILVIFKDLDSKMQLFKNLKNLGNADTDECIKIISVSHDMSQAERDNSRDLVDKAKKKELADPEHRYRVRGPPGNLKIVRLPLPGRSD
jgi:Tfp pilus assembly protein PilO